MFAPKTWKIFRVTGHVTRSRDVFVPLYEEMFHIYCSFSSLFFFVVFSFTHFQQSLDLLCVVDLRFVSIETERSAAVGQLDANRTDSTVD